DDAVTALRKAIQLDPQRVEAYYNLGLVYKRKGQSDLSISAYKEALRLNPRMADAHLNLANLYMEKQQPRPALRHYEEALKVRTGWDKALGGVEAAQDAIEQEEQQVAARQEEALGPVAGTAATVRAATPENERVVDPVIHATFLTTLHDAAKVSEE